MQSQQAIAPSLSGRRRPLLQRAADAVLRRTLEPLVCGEIVVDLPSGGRLAFVGHHPGPQARVRVHSWRALARIVFGGSMGVAEGYMAGEWSSPDLEILLTLVARHSPATEPLQGLPVQQLWLRLCHAMNRNSRRGSRRNIAAHYDLGNAFYRHWLDAGMSYSSGLFPSSDTSLEQAQAVKLDRVLDMLGLSGGERVLEIGCGWGSFAERMLRRHDGHLTGITLSSEQLDYAQARLRSHVEAGRCDLRLQDYREIDGTFDRIVSIEMLEAVGEAYWPTYFRTLRERLRPGGSAVLQVITIDEGRFADYRRRPDFIQKHVFPGGMLPTSAIIAREAEQAGLDLIGVEFFAESYARTLAHWRTRFEQNWSAIAPLGFDERFRRMWEFYLAYCEAGFKSGALNVGLYGLRRGGMHDGSRA